MILAIQYERVGRYDEALALAEELEKISEFTDMARYLRALQGDDSSLNKFAAIAENSNNLILILIRLVINLYFKLEKYDESALWLDKL